MMLRRDRRLARRRSRVASAAPSLCQTGRRLLNVNAVGEGGVRQLSHKEHRRWREDSTT